ncbi:MAG: Tol-Pal system beta propeller repeat protein TolB [Gammaproteobacteria bacterium]|nr:MAG: Tol-Pal system beta propeller repeat protein TolB [Gammaproteobacteria bacterium]
MKTLINALAGLFLLLCATWTNAQLQIEVTEGVDDPTAIAVVPFKWTSPGTAPEDVAAIVHNDLERSGLFAPVDRADMLGRPSSADEVFYRDWRALNTEYLLIGRMSMNGPREAGTLRIDYELYDVLRQNRMLAAVSQGPAQEARMLAHQVADVVYEKLTGIRGAFATRLVYVSVTRVENDRDFFRLTLADSDGARPIVLLESREPVLAPNWSPNGQEIAYVSFENTRPAIFRQNLVTGEREQLTNFRGLNSSPTFSPDGKSMAMVLSKDGNPDLYLMDLASKRLRRLTRHYAIDTEPTWMPDGESILFTSDRGGKPQVYRYDLATGSTERVTYEGSYNARPRMAQDGRNLVMVRRQDGQFHIALQDLVSNRSQILTSTQLDESPSIAPNGSMILYATKSGGRGVLGAVSTDGGVKYLLPSREGEVREPAWSPYMNGR